MKQLNQIMGIDYNIVIDTIEDDSRVEQPNGLFFCIEGINRDGHDYAEEAIQNGAVAVVASKPLNVSVPVISVEDTNKAMIQALNHYYDNVLDYLKLIGITGTDGKTTLSNIIFQLINQFDKAGYIGTSGVLSKETSYKTGLTTPFPKDLFSIFHQFRKEEVHYVAMEVSSERLMTNRLASMQFDIAIFTNLTRDHMNSHKTFENYKESKGKLFQMVKPEGYSIINVDDPHCNYFMERSNNKVITYGIKNGAIIRASNIEIKAGELTFDLNALNRKYKIKSPLSGIYNVYNLMAAIGALYVLGFPIEKTIEYIESLETIKGRSDVIDYNGTFKVIIDYAHTPNALTNILEYARTITKGKVITVTGAAGARDREKRPIIGNIVAKLSDYFIFTMDDPRYEEVVDIIQELSSEFDLTIQHYHVEIDRAKAIREALEMAKDGDVVLIAGRGDDTKMPVKDTFVFINDYQEVYRNMI